MEHDRLGIMVYRDEGVPFDFYTFSMYKESSFIG